MQVLGLHHCRQSNLPLLSEIFLVLFTLRSRRFLPNRFKKSSVLFTVLPVLIHPITADSSKYFRRWNDPELSWKSEVDRNGAHTVLCGTIPHIAKSDSTVQTDVPVCLPGSQASMRDVLIGMSWSSFHTNTNSIIVKFVKRR